jgi:hypothetical protein
MITQLMQLSERDGTFVEIQIKAGQKMLNLEMVRFLQQFHMITERINWFIFYSERIDTTFILSSKEFLKESVQKKPEE